MLVDTQDLLMAAIVHPANLHDRDGGVLLMSSLFGFYPFVTKLFADGGYSGKTFRGGVAKACPAPSHRHRQALQDGEGF